MNLHFLYIMLGLYHLFFPLSQGRDESEKDSGLEPISPGTCQRQLSVTKRVYLFCRFLTSVVYCA